MYKINQANEYEGCKSSFHKNQLIIMQAECKWSEFLWLALLCDYLKCSKIISYVPHPDDFVKSGELAHPFYSQGSDINKNNLKMVELIRFGKVRHFKHVLHFMQVLMEMLVACGPIASTYHIHPQ